MARLTSTQLVGLSTELTQIYALRPVERFPSLLLSVVDRLIGCDSASYNEIDITTGAHRVLVAPSEMAHETLDEAFGAHMHQHPVIAHYVATGDTRSHMISDFLHRREFRRLGLYAELFAPLGIDAQLSTTMATGPRASVIGVALNRGKHGFGERERTLLDLLRPHFLVAYSNARRYSAALGGAGQASQRAAAAAAMLDCLTERQHEVLGLVSQGHTNHQIAHELDISAGTVKKHLEHILDRLDVHTRVAAASTYLAATRIPTTERLDTG
jgi:DNA-binding CsgD family transcriptional regulator